MIKIIILYFIVGISLNKNILCDFLCETAQTSPTRNGVSRV
jgi:hypothetical protein